MPESIRELTRAIAAGDTEAFARFYERWFDVAFAEAARFCRGDRRDEAFCLDVVQETMMTAIRAMPVLESEASLRAWLRAVVQSRCRDLLRRETRRVRRERAAMLGGGRGGRRHGHEAPALGSADDELHERLAWVHAALAQLPPAQSNLVSLRYRMGWTLQRIGVALGLSAGAVDGRLSRAIAALQARAKEDFHE